MGPSFAAPPLSNLHNGVEQIALNGVAGGAPTPLPNLVRVQGSGFRVQGVGFRVQGSGFRVWGLGSVAWGLGFGVRG